VLHSDPLTAATDANPHQFEESLIQNAAPLPLDTSTSIVALGEAKSTAAIG